MKPPAYDEDHDDASAEVNNGGVIWRGKGGEERNSWNVPLCHGSEEVEHDPDGAGTHDQ